MENQFEVVVRCFLLTLCFRKTYLLTFDSLNSVHNVTEGEDIDLECDVRNEYPVSIFLDKSQSDVIIAQNWSLIDKTRLYSYQHRKEGDGVHHTLVLYNISRSASGRYVCLQLEPRIDQQSITLNVLYNASNPVCTSLSETVFLTDEVQHQEVNFMCTVEDVGDPMCSTSSFTGSPRDSKITSVFVEDDHKHIDTLSFIPSVDMNNTIIQCVRAQDSPVSTTSPLVPLRRTCDFPKIRFLRDLILHILPSNRLVVSDVGVHILHCLSNVRNLTRIAWNIVGPHHDGITFMVNSDVVIFNIDRSLARDKINHTIELECIGTFKDQRRVQRGTLQVQMNPATSTAAISTTPASSLTLFTIFAFLYLQRR